ncbi:MAG: hypothetical protein OJF50_005288 [Nitrospira sp.]|nr:hypothetical protein [Nitrospira sp.]
MRHTFILYLLELRRQVQPMALLDFPIDKDDKIRNRLSVSMDIQIIRQPS